MLVPWMPETFHAQSNMTEMLLFGFSLTFQVKNGKYKGGGQATNRKHKTYFGPNKVIKGTHK